MKRWLLLIAAALLLSACAARQDETTPIPDSTEPIVASATEPTGYYDPDSALEASTEGAVRVYPLNRTDSYALVSMDEDLLLLSGSEVTTLTKLTGSNLYVSAAANLGCYISADSPAFHAGPKGVTYYDESHAQLVFLDTNLKEVSRISLPESIVGGPTLASDRKMLYYCTENAIRAIDLETNLDKLLRETSYVSHSIRALHWGNSVLECNVEDSYGNRSTLFISASTGETLHETTDEISLWTVGQNYFSAHYEGAYRELLTGSGEESPLLLVPAEYDAPAEPVMENTAAILFSSDAESATLNYYDLAAGTRTYSLRLPGSSPILDIESSVSQQCIWFLRHDAAYESDTLCRWDLAKTATGDEANYLSIRYDADNPDQEGIAACRETAAAIGKKHGVEILLWTDALSKVPQDYTSDGEYQVPLLKYSLSVLDKALSAYPSGFLKDAAAGTDNGKITICLVRSVTGNNNAAESGELSGLQYWDWNENAYIVVSAGEEMVSSLYNELFHIIDNRVIGSCPAFDDWDDLNPKDFAYLNSYTILTAPDNTLFEGENRAFTDIHATTFSREDRARIMEYAMMEGNEDCFASDIMQSKLRKLCLGIRETFGLEKSSDTFLWEQYLSKPLYKK